MFVNIGYMLANPIYMLAKQDVLHSKCALPEIFRKSKYILDVQHTSALSIDSFELKIFTYKYT